MLNYQRAYGCIWPSLLLRSCPDAPAARAARAARADAMESPAKPQVGKLWFGWLQTTTRHGPFIDGLPINSMVIFP